ncbi:hypothetical protein TrVE_jg9953 [Triparma verrucosa]|uniref:Uncharacterized protein n=1 Tax=Triparma verrucosa TaxID=1606542 RepID=A0A9W7EWY9_9STRA|nr:hypothetical protein TrVE_jg9953 [Triparma verrucosa]
MEVGNGGKNVKVFVWRKMLMLMGGVVCFMGGRGYILLKLETVKIHKLYGKNIYTTLTLGLNLLPYA